MYGRSLSYILTVANTSESLAPDALRREREETMSKASESEEMMEEYDFSKGVRGKYARACHHGSNVIILDPDLAKWFPNSEAVNQALRSLAGIQDRKQA